MNVIAERLITAMAEIPRHLQNCKSVYDLSFGFISNTTVQLHVNCYEWPAHLLISLLDSEHNQQLQGPC